MDAEEAIARESMRETMARYNHAGDRGQLDELVACFAQDGVLDVEGDPPLVGREAIRHFLQRVVEDARAATSRPLMRHHVSSIFAERTGVAEGVARSYFFVLTDVGPDHWGTYRDRFRRVGNRWLIEHRSVRVDGASPETRFAEHIHR